MHNTARAARKKRTDSKNEPFLGRFGRETGGWRAGKSILFCIFSHFSGILRLQVIAVQYFADFGTLQKKSCLKTSRRFFDFRELCHNRPMNYENDEIMGRKKEKMGRWN